MGPLWRVEIYSRPDGVREAEIVHSIPAKSKDNAERIERGVSINLNHSAYYTHISANFGDGKGWV